QFLDHHALEDFFRTQDVEILSDLFLDVGQFINDLLLLHAGEALELQFDDGLGLTLGEARAARIRIDHLGVGGGFGGRDEIHQRFTGFTRRLGGADQGDHGVQVREGPLEAEQNVLAVTRLAQQEVRTAADDVDAMLDEAFERVKQSQLARLTVDDGQQDDAKVHLHLGLLIQVIENHFSLFAALQLKHDAHAVAVALIADFRNSFELLLVYQSGGIFDEPCFVDLVGQLRDNDGLPLLAHLFGGGFRAHFDGTSASLEVVVDALAAEDNAASGEIGALHHLDQLRKLDSWILYQRNTGLDDLPQIV